MSKAVFGVGLAFVAACGSSVLAQCCTNSGVVYMGSSPMVTQTVMFETFGPVRPVCCHPIVTEMVWNTCPVPCAMESAVFEVGQSVWGTPVIWEASEFDNCCYGVAINANTGFAGDPVADNTESFAYEVPVSNEDIAIEGQIIGSDNVFTTTANKEPIKSEKVMETDDVSALTESDEVGTIDESADSIEESDEFIDDEEAEIQEDDIETGNDDLADEDLDNEIDE